MDLILSSAQPTWLHCSTNKNIEQTTGKETLTAAFLLLKFEISIFLLELSWGIINSYQSQISCIFVQYMLSPRCNYFELELSLNITLSTVQQVFDKIIYWLKRDLKDFCTDSKW